MVQGIASERLGARPAMCRTIAPSVVRRPKSASAWPGPCTRPRSADALTRREYHPARQAAGVKLVAGAQPSSGGQLIQVIPALDLVVVITSDYTQGRYDAPNLVGTTIAPAVTG